MNISKEQSWYPGGVPGVHSLGQLCEHDAPKPLEEFASKLENGEVPVKRQAWALRREVFHILDPGQKMLHLADNPVVQVEIRGNNYVWDVWGTPADDSEDYLVTASLIAAFKISSYK